ncbi:hypothetical protein ACQR1L_22505 [Bradyrhizobium sp. HKCCYLR20261]|uniref:hypothetical protein n=1 Tax=unclassified Bradyrhizobium TaxID=2631580 RepID=UPI003EB8D394
MTGGCRPGSTAPRLHHVPWHAERAVGFPKSQRRSSAPVQSAKEGMRSADTSALAAQAILADPLFPYARLCYVDSVLKLYAERPRLVELMRDAARIMTYGIVMSYWGGYRLQESSTWLTISRLKTVMAQFEVASDRQLDHILARLVDTGYVTLHQPPQDSRLRVIHPTSVMIEHDLEWMRAHYVPLAILHGDSAYALALNGDPGFHPHLRAASIPLFPHIARNVLSQNTAMTRFLNRAFGVLALMKIVQAIARRDGAAMSYSALGSAFGVSRTHVRDIFAGEAGHGEAIVARRRGFALAPSLLRSFDQLVADGMVVSAIAYETAQRDRGEALQGRH